jgi:hypothetical protein
MVQENKTKAEGRVGVTTQAIVNGSLIDPSIGMGVPTIWGFSNASQEWRQICSSTLIDNNFVLTALHCFQSENFRSDVFFVTHGGEAKLLVGGEVAPGDLDVALMLADSPFTVRGSTSGYGRHGTNGVAGATVFAVGTGLSIEGETGVPSSVCQAGTQGCEGDQRPLRISVHTTFWDDSRSDSGTELGVLTNSSNQHPTFGDSGGPLLNLTSVFGDLLDQELMGVSARMFVDEHGVWHSHYTPLQHFWPWLCGIFGC